MPRNHALSRRMLPARISHVEAFELAASAGFTGVEMAPGADDEAVRAVQVAVGTTGVEVSAVVCKRPAGPAYFDRLGDELECNIDAGVTAIRSAAAWGARTVLITPGLVDARTSPEEAWQRSAEVISERLVPVARDLGIVLGIENTWRSFLMTAADQARYVDEQASPCVGAYFDTGNVIFGHPEHWIGTLGARIVGVHYKDYVMRPRWSAGYFRFAIPGSGSVDWAAVDGRLADVGYRGWLTQAGAPLPIPLLAANRVQRVTAHRRGVAAATITTGLDVLHRRLHARQVMEMGRRNGNRDRALSAARAARPPGELDVGPADRDQPRS